MKDKISNKKDVVEETSSGYVLGKNNYIVLAIGFVLIILGFILLSGGRSSDPTIFNQEIFSFTRITLAPIVIVLGFIIELFAIMWKGGK